MGRQIVRLFVGLFIVITQFACTSMPTPKYKDIWYDYVIASPYMLTKKHKNIYFEIDAENLSAPKVPLRIPALKLKKVLKKRKAQIVVYIHVANSFLKLRPAGIRKEVIFNSGNRGVINNVAIQRAHIRTHYTIEVVDVLTKTLIDQFNGAKNYPIEFLDTFDTDKNRKTFKKVFLEKSIAARKKVMSDIWLGLEPVYLKQIQVIFKQVKNNVVKSLETEPKLNVAFKYLNANNKKSAKQALNVYNFLLKKYTKLDGDYNNKIRSYADHGVTVSTSIVNHQHEDRFP